MKNSQELIKRSLLDVLHSEEEIIEGSDCISLMTFGGNLSKGSC